LGLNTSLCNWILDFLMGCPQVVRVGNNTEAPQGYVLNPLLYSLFTHDCTARHNSNTIIKFADDTTVVGLINDDTAYREEVKDLAVWCQDKNLSLNVIKTKEMIVDYIVVEQVKCFKFLYTRQCQRKALKIGWTPATLVIDQSLCYRTASGTGVSSLGPRGF
jgi:hypothetical protein